MPSFLPSVEEMFVEKETEKARGHTAANTRMDYEINLE
jgi:hypothetical protein